MSNRLELGRPAAAARMQGGPSASELTGVVWFYPDPLGVVVVAQIRGLPHRDAPCAAGIFALHIHEGSACAGQDFSETGGHYNPQDCPHPAHAGDLPPLFACGGRAFLAVLTDRFRVPDVIGRTVVIHSEPDDFRTQPAGNSGQKIACGVIRAL